MEQDPEACSLGGQSLASPLIGSPLIGSPPKQPKPTWWSDSRQGSKSTAASCSDFRLPQAFSPPLPSRLEQLQEMRTWKHFVQQKMGIPLALLVGSLLGAALTAAFSLHTAPRAAIAPEAADTAPYALPMPPTEVPLAYMTSPSLNNSCLIPNLVIPEGPRTFDACGFVIKSTDEVWNSRGDVDAAIDKYFHEDYLDAGSWGRRIIGKKALRDAIFSEMRAFPDIRIHITDCVCQGNDNDGYKCAMPDILTGTNLGPSAYGPATGRYARWTGLVQSLVQRNRQTGQWQYVAEWGVHDEWALIQQLGLDFSRVPRPPMNSEPLHDCAPLLQFTPSAKMDANDAAMQQAHVRAEELMRR